MHRNCSVLRIPVLATEDIRSKNRRLEGEHLVLRLKMPWSLEGEKLRGERLRSLAHVLEAPDTACHVEPGRG